MAMADPTDPNTPADQGAAQGAKTTSQPAAGAPAAGVDVQAEVQKALAAQAAEHAKQLKEATGHDSIASWQDAQQIAKGEHEKVIAKQKAELADVNARLKSQTINNAILGAAVGAHNPAQVAQLLAGKATVGADGGTVTIDGKPAAAAVEAFAKDNPWLFKPAGPAGSGAPQSAGASGTPNPWAQATFNLTEQGRIATENPAEAERLRAAAGL
jgi:hypothetical protein